MSEQNFKCEWVYDKHGSPPSTKLDIPQRAKEVIRNGVNKLSLRWNSSELLKYARDILIAQDMSHIAAKVEMTKNGGGGGGGGGVGGG